MPQLEIRRSDCCEINYNLIEKAMEDRFRRIAKALGERSKIDESKERRSQNHCLTNSLYKVKNVNTAVKSVSGNLGKWEAVKIYLGSYKKFVLGNRDKFIGKSVYFLLNNIAFFQYNQCIVKGKS